MTRHDVQTPVLVPSLHNARSNEWDSLGPSSECSEPSASNARTRTYRILATAILTIGLTTAPAQAGNGENRAFDNSFRDNGPMKDGSAGTTTKWSSDLTNFNSNSHQSLTSDTIDQGTTLHSSSSDGTQQVTSGSSLKSDSGNWKNGKFESD